MTYHITSYDALQAYLSAAEAMTKVCRADSDKVEHSQEKTENLLLQIERQLAELRGVQTELKYMSGRMCTLQ